ncbi:187-kDa microtubule-associated protein AIR9 isoform X4 [Arachis ipaensis]|uniref:187-kDa microtubule-associated protein AIR9 isoform X4 n=1 Tax=Arachis ipaensis TaxID=130454 RepID=UPI000A2B3E6E|nr:187-kDa microtubule-associated protein AIR9 isoform X4 [Arachis ipaensis]
MEEPSEHQGEVVKPENPQTAERKASSEAGKRASSKTAANTGGSVPARKRVTEPRNGSGSSALAAKRSSSSTGSVSSVSVPRRNSIGGLPKKPSISDEKRKAGADSAAGVKGSTEMTRRSLPELRRNSVTSSPRAGVAAKPALGSPVGLGLRTSVSKVDVVKKPLSRPALSVSSSRSVRSSVDSTASSGHGGSSRRMVLQASSPSVVRSPSVSSGSRAGSLSSTATSIDRSSSLSRRRKVGTPDTRDSRFIVLPQVDNKANDDVRLDLRGHRVRSLNASGLNLSSNLEFVYLRDNLLSTLDGVEILTRVKVLDLSFNDFKGPGFEPLENCKVLQQLYLAGNQITSLASLPQLPNLEFLSVAQNKLKSLTMASQPRLQVLAASKNRISTLKGFPYLPVLEHLRVEENPILKMPHLEAASILLVGPTLKKYNDRDLSREEMALAKRYPAQTALCIRDGWEFGRPEQAAESTFRFLAEKWKDHIPPGFLLKEASIDKPSEEDVCHCHFTVIPDGAVSVDSPLVLKYQWFSGDKTLSNFVSIPDATGEIYWPKHDDIGKILKVECTPCLGETEYPSIFAVSPAVSRGSGIPKVVTLEVHGELVEGSIIKGCAKVAWCGGTPGKGVASWLRRKWNSSPVVIAGAEDEEYLLTLDDVDSSLVFMYTPVTEEGAKGEPQYKYTDFIKAGQEGKSLSARSPVVKQAPPKVTNVKIIGDLRENSKVTATGIVTGGTEGSSRVQWFKTYSSTLDENSLEALSSSKIAKAFRIPLGAVGCYIVAKYTPMTPDGDYGEPAFVISDRAVETLPPSLNFLSIIGDYSEGGILTASYGYVGGHEGKSIYNWYLHEVDGDVGSSIPGVTGLQYRITKEAIGKFISFQCTPVRDDGVVADLRICMGQERIRPGSPRLLSLRIIGNAVEGTMLNVEKKYWGGEEGDSTYRWFRTSSDGTQSEIMGATMESYTPSLDDIGFFISVSCEPVRCDWARGPMVVSEQIGPIIPGIPKCHFLEFLGSFMEGKCLKFNAVYSGGERGECTNEWFRVKENGLREKISCCADFLNLTLEDIGVCIELLYNPVRKDGIKGSPKRIVSDVISPADPMGIELIVPNCCEGTELVPIKKYFGGHEGAGEYIWYRTKNKLEGSALLDISNASDVVICGRDLTYTPSLIDVESYLALYWVPTRADGKCGEPLISLCSSPVSPAPPIVSNVRLIELSSGIYSGDGVYFGGYEGESLFSWYRENNEGTIELIEGANSKTYKVTDSDYNCRILFGYTPVRSDLVVGELRLSDPTDIVLPELPYVEMLALTGKAVEGDVLTAVEVIPNSEAQQHVWNKYKKEIRYQWFCSSEVGDYDPLPNQCSCSYKVRLEDIGRRLKCECVVTDVFGRTGDVVYIETTPVLPGIPRIQKLEIEGRGFHTNLYAVRGIYNGGKEGKSRIQWLRSMVGSPDLISIPGINLQAYPKLIFLLFQWFERLVAIYTPVREDGVEGQSISVSTEPIAVEPDVIREVKQNLDLGSVKFEVLCDKDQNSKKISTVGTYERRILEVNKKRVKVVKPATKTSFPTTEIRGSYAPPFHVELFRNDQHRLKIVVDSENEADLMVHSRHIRDVIVLVVRGFAQRFNSTSLNSLLKIET